MKLNINFLKNLPKKEKKITLSTKITIARILLVPFIIYFMIRKSWFISFWLILASAISDLLDGLIARLRNERTILGACLDPVADKLFIVSCYFILSFGYLPNFTLPFWFTFLVFFKELFLIIGALFLYVKYGWVEIKPTWLGKLTMDVQTIFVLWIFISYFFKFHFVIIDKLFLFTIVVLILSSFLQYAKIGIKQFKKNT